MVYSNVAVIYVNRFDFVLVKILVANRNNVTHNYKHINNFPYLFV